MGWAVGWGWKVAIEIEELFGDGENGELASEFFIYFFTVTGKTLARSGDMATARIVGSEVFSGIFTAIYSTVISGAETSVVSRCIVSGMGVVVRGAEVFIVVTGTEVSVVITGTDTSTGAEISVVITRGEGSLLITETEISLSATGSETSFAVIGAEISVTETGSEFLAITGTETFLCIAGIEISVVFTRTRGVVFLLITGMSTISGTSSTTPFSPFCSV